MTREEAKREILFAKREVMADSYIDKAFDMAIKALEQPEIIWCKDCRYYGDVDEHEHWCNGCGWPARLITPFDFCSRGVRKEDG